MKKTLKIAGISFASIISILLIVISIVCYFVFTPERLTPIVREQADKFLKCNSEIEEVNLTFFSSFPDFALEITNLTLTDSIETTDTIAHIATLSVDVNLTEFLFNSNLIINGVDLSGALAYIHVDSVGNANYDILNLPSSEDEEEDTTASELLDMMKVETIDINNFTAIYIDEQQHINASVAGLNVHVNGGYEGSMADANVELLLGNLNFAIGDTSIIEGRIKETEIVGAVSIQNKNVEAKLSSLFPSVNFVIDGDTLAKDLNLGVLLPFEWNSTEKLLTLNDAHLEISKLIFDIVGRAQILEHKGIEVDMNIDTKKWTFDDILALVPKSYSGFLADFKSLDGNTTINANAKGIYNDSVFPIFNASMLIDDVTIHHNALPEYKLDKTMADIDVLLDLNDKHKSSANIRKFYTSTGTTFVEAKGSVKDFMQSMLMDLDLFVDVNLPELYPIIPDSLPIKMTGRTSLDVHVLSTKADLQKQRLERILASGTIRYKDLDVVYNDSIHVFDKAGSMELSLPAKVSNKQFKPLLSFDISGSQINFNMKGKEKSQDMKAVLDKPHLSITATNPLKKDNLLCAAVQFNLGDLDFAMDSLIADVNKPVGYASISPAKSDPSKPLLTVAYKSDSVKLKNGTSFEFTSDVIDVKAFSRYIEDETNTFLKWNPMLDVDFNNGHLSMAAFPSDISIPKIKFWFTPRRAKIEQSRIIVEDSDFSLSGDVTNMRKYIKGEELLIGKLDFISNQTNIDQLMAFFSGFGGSEPEIEPYSENVDVVKDDEEIVGAATAESKKEESEVNPFMVPKGVDIVFNTQIRNAIFNEQEIENVGGKLTIKDGKVVLEQMGFTADAAEMQISGMYRSDRANHLFAGLNFHLLDIDIESLIDLIPDIDSVVPMLASFQGKGEFHLVAETYLKSDYSPKMSTLRAAAAFEGKDLVILDSEMFETIAKYMMFSRKAENIVDSLAVEMTIFRNEVDIYPFLISMDRWQAVLSGRHNLDMTFNYHISLTDCPLPVRLGLDIKGDLDNMEFDLVPCKYKEMYKPDRNKDAMQQRTLALKKTISDALKEKVKK